MPGLSLMPREQKFFDLFEAGAKNTVNICEALKELGENFQDTEVKLGKIVTLENEGDTITHNIISQLSQSFITPFDRQDISALAQTLDGVADSVEAAANDMCRYGICQPTPAAVELSRLLVKQANKVEVVVPYLRHTKTLKNILPICIEINRLENEVDVIYRAAKAALFDNPSDYRHIIKWLKIYEDIEEASDRCEDVADILEGIVLKNA